METKSRDIIQLECKTAIIESLDLCNKAVIKASVGFGKSKVMLDTLLHYNPDKITWLTSSEELRDVDTINEFYKWNCEHLLERTSIMCYQSSYKLENQDLGFVICDEGDVLLTEAYIKSIMNNKFDKCLIVSGTFTEDKLDILKKIEFPVVYEITTSEAQFIGILNNTFIHFIDYDLDRTKDRLIQTKTKSWMTSENEQYCYIEGQFLSQIIQLEALKKQADTHFNVARIPGFNYDEFKKKKLAINMKLKWIVSQRAKILHTLDSSKRIAKQISNILLQNQDNKVMVFSSLTEHLDSFIDCTVHSKNKKNNTYLDDFNKGIIREVGCISMLDRGKNMVGLNNSIFESYDGSATKWIQRLGRNARLDASDTAHLYVLIPYYYTKQGKRTPTRSLGWALSGFENYDLNEFNHEFVNINQLEL